MRVHQVSRVRGDIGEPGNPIANTTAVAASAAVKLWVTCRREHLRTRGGEVKIPFLHAGQNRSIRVARPRRERGDVRHYHRAAAAAAESAPPINSVFRAQRNNRVPRVIEKPTYVFLSIYRIPLYLRSYEMF